MQQSKYVVGQSVHHGYLAHIPSKCEVCNELDFGLDSDINWSIITTQHSILAVKNTSKGFFYKVDGWNHWLAEDQLYSTAEEVMSYLTHRKSERRRALEINFPHAHAVSVSYDVDVSNLEVVS